ncbi:hypothetical protein [Bdellovibrio sp. KM01]|uniref:hypothetical protein n=1 Tax=Bdellovibrio sp. KM01 TaxID=2748865 RepID=UPI0015EA2609|nr:hypothetical protein [Bdellovibrio sp. KM01]QLY24651.1 hypothetical protein HW988_14495 [Bdellovibrio sp. KM01]
MKILVMVLLLTAAEFSWAQVQSQQQCVTTIRARSLSISSADAEKLCSGDYPEVVNCAVTAKQTSLSSMDDALKKCRGEWGTTGKDVTPKEPVKPAAATTKEPASVQDPSPKDSKKADGAFEEM